MPHVTVLCATDTLTVRFTCPRDFFVSGCCFWLWCLSTRGQEGSLKLLGEKSPRASEQLHQRYPCLFLQAVPITRLQARAVCWGPAVHPRRALQGQSRNAPVFPSGHLPSTPLQDVPEAERRDPAHGLLPGSCSTACSSPPAPTHTLGEGWPWDSAAHGWVVALRWPHSQKGKVPKFLGTGCGGR